MLFLTGDISGGEWAQIEFGRLPWEDPALLLVDLADLAGGERPDAAADPARGARPALHGRPGRGAVHGAAVAPAGRCGFMRVPDESHELTRGGDAVPARREPGPGARLVRPLPGARASAGCPRRRGTAPGARHRAGPRCHHSVGERYARAMATPTVHGSARDRAGELVRALDPRAASLGSVLGRVTLLESDTISPIWRVSTPPSGSCRYIHPSEAFSASTIALPHADGLRSYARKVLSINPPPKFSSSDPKDSAVEISPVSPLRRSSYSWME